MHTAVIQSPQAMSNEQSYRPRSPDLPAVTETQTHQEQQQRTHLRLSRLPSYQIEEPTLPKGYSFSPRGSYDASPFFSQPLQGPTNPFVGIQQRDSYAEQSPSSFAPTTHLDHSRVFSPISYTNSPQRPQQPATSLQNSNFQFSPTYQQSVQTFQPPIDEMARLRSRKPVNYNEDHNGAQYEEPPPPPFAQPQVMQHMPTQLHQPSHMPQYPGSHQYMQQPMSLAQPMPLPMQQPPASSAPQMPNVDVKTKFPVARIKRIMQADEDVGKVAQATPTAVSKALELFMIALVTKGAVEAKNQNSKRVTATHLKHTLLADPQFDFLNEICEAVPDEGGKGSKGRAKSEAKSEDSDDDMGAAAKKKAKASRKKKSGDDDGSD